MTEREGDREGRKRQAETEEEGYAPRKLMYVEEEDDWGLASPGPSGGAEQQYPAKKREPSEGHRVVGASDWPYVWHARTGSTRVAEREDAPDIFSEGKEFA